MKRCQVNANADGEQLWRVARDRLLTLIGVASEGVENGGGVEEARLWHGLTAWFVIKGCERGGGDRE